MMINGLPLLLWLVWGFLGTLLIVMWSVLYFSWRAEQNRIDDEIALARYNIEQDEKRNRPTYHIENQQINNIGSKKRNRNIKEALGPLDAYLKADKQQPISYIDGSIGADDEDLFRLPASKRG